MFTMYILECRDKTFYKGLTNNIERRFAQHQAGKVSSTRNKLPVKIVHVEKFPTRIEAREREKYFKSGAGREKLKLLLQ